MRIFKPVIHSATSTPLTMHSGPSLSNLFSGLDEALLASKSVHGVVIYYGTATLLGLAFVLCSAWMLVQILNTFTKMFGALLSSAKNVVAMALLAVAGSLFFQFGGRYGINEALCDSPFFRPVGPLCTSVITTLFGKTTM